MVERVFFVVVCKIVVYLRAGVIESGGVDGNHDCVEREIDNDRRHGETKVEFAFWTSRTDRKSRTLLNSIRRRANEVRSAEPTN